MLLGEFHGHATWGSSMAMLLGGVPWPCYSGEFHGHATREEFHGHATGGSSMAMLLGEFHGHATAGFHGHATRGVPWPCYSGSSMAMLLRGSSMAMLLGGSSMAMLLGGSMAMLLGGVPWPCYSGGVPWPCYSGEFHGTVVGLWVWTLGLETRCWHVRAGLWVASGVHPVRDDVPVGGCIPPPWQWCRRVGAGEWVLERDSLNVLACVDGWVGADIWALGCILYEMMCLRKPFEAETVPDLVYLVLKTDYPGPAPLVRWA